MLTGNLASWPTEPPESQKVTCSVFFNGGYPLLPWVNPLPCSGAMTPMGNVRPSRTFPLYLILFSLRQTSLNGVDDLRRGSADVNELVIRVPDFCGLVKLVDESGAITRDKIVDIQFAFLEVLLRKQRRTGSLDLAVGGFVSPGAGMNEPRSKMLDLMQDLLAGKFDRRDERAVRPAQRLLQPIELAGQTGFCFGKDCGGPAIQAFLDNFCDVAVHT